MKKEIEDKWNYFILGVFAGIGIGFWGLVLFQSLTPK